MNFAALGFIISLDDDIVTGHFFVDVRTKNDLFNANDKFDKKEIAKLNSISAFLPSFCTKGVCKCFNYVTITFLIVILAISATLEPFKMFGIAADYRLEGGEYFMKEWGTWYDEEWFKTAMDNKEF